MNFRVVTIAQLLKAAGYRTYLTGKWHLGSDAKRLPHARGYDRAYSLADAGADNFEQRPIEVVSARPDWVELVVPCERESADRIREFMAQLDTDLPEDVRTRIGQAFGELLMNAIEWGGKLDPTKSVRIS